MNRLLASMFFLLLYVLSLAVYAQNLDIHLPDQKLSWTLADIKQKVPVQQVKLFDPVYNSNKSFDGVSLLQLLKAAGYITEYWTEEHLTAFIPNAPGYRYKSKMPAFAQLSAKDIDHLVVYLKHMKGYKIQLP